MENKKKKCSICLSMYEGYGNNAEPLNKGICCDGCNWKVISARLEVFGITSTNQPTNQPSTNQQKSEFLLDYFSKQLKHLNKNSHNYYFVKELVEKHQAIVNNIKK